MLEAKKNNKVSSQRMLGDKASLFGELGKKKDVFSSLESKLNIQFKLLFSLFKLLVRLMKVAVAVYGAKRMNPTDYGVKS